MQNRNFVIIKITQKINHCLIMEIFLSKKQLDGQIDIDQKITEYILKLNSFSNYLFSIFSDYFNIFFYKKRIFNLRQVYKKKQESFYINYFYINKIFLNRCIRRSFHGYIIVSIFVSFYFSNLQMKNKKNVFIFIEDKYDIKKILINSICFHF